MPAGGWPVNARPSARFMTSTTRPLVPTAVSPMLPSFQAARHRSSITAAAVLPLIRWPGRSACARTTARTAPKLEMAACCASFSVIPIAVPAAAISRR